MQDHEEPVRLCEMIKIDADSLVRAFKSTLLGMNVQVTDCHWQCYDRAYIMGGSRNGMATQITREENWYLYTFTA